MRRHAHPIAMSVSSGVVLLGTFLPWVQFGARRRSSYLLLGLVDRLEFTRGSLQSAAVRAWPLVPMLLVGAAYATWMHRFRLGGALGIVAALYAGGLAVAVRQAPVLTLAGVDLVIVGGCLLLTASVVQLALRRSP